MLQALLDLANAPESDLRKQASQMPSQDAVSADQFACHLIWLGGEPMLPERSYRGLAAGQDFSVQVTDLTYDIDQQSGEHLAAKVLEKGRVAYCKIALDAAVPFDPQKPSATSGIRLGSPAGTTRGFGIRSSSWSGCTNANRNPAM